MLTASVLSISGVDPVPIRERIAETAETPVHRTYGRPSVLPALALAGLGLSVLGVLSSRRARRRRMVGLGTVVIGSLVLGALTRVTGGM